MFGDDNVNIKVDVDGAKKASSDLKGVSKSTDNLGTSAGKSSAGTSKLSGALSKLGTIALSAGAAGIAALTGAFVKSITKAMEFETLMGDISTLISGDSTQAVNELRDGILNMAQAIPKTPDELGAAAYDVVSAGIEGTANQLNVLEQSAKLAVAGLGDTKGSVDIMTSSLNAFKIPAEDSNKVADILFKTVKNGKTTVDELSMSFGATAPTIAAAGISLEDFSAATAALTTTGMPASVAQTALRQSIVALTKPTKEMKGLFEKIGVEGLPEMIDKGWTMGEIFGKLEDAAGGNAEELSKAYGSVEAYNAAIGVGSIVNEKYTDTLNDMTEGTNAVDEAFEKQRETATEQWQLIKNKLSVAMIKLGAVILPKITGAAKWLRDKFEEWKPTLTDIWNKLKEFGNTLKDIVLPQLIRLKDALVEAWPWLSKLLIVVGVIIGVLTGLAILLTVGVAAAIYKTIAIIIEIINWFAKLRQKLQDFMLNGLEKLKELWKNVWDGIKNIFNKVVSGISTALRVLKNVIVGIFNAIKNKVTSIWEGLWNGIKNIAKGVGGAVKGAIKSVLNGLIGILNKGISTINSAIDKIRGIPKIGGLVPDINIPEIPKLAKGGDLKAGQTGVVGEEGVELFTPKVAGRVTPNNEIGNITNHFHIGSIDSKETADYFAQKVNQVLNQNALRARMRG